MSKKAKLLARVLTRPKDFTWDEACSLMRACGFELKKRPGSARMFVHAATGRKVRLHEPHPRPTLLPYMLDELLEGLIAVGELSDEDRT